jgi:hypothetical protein
VSRFFKTGHIPDPEIVRQRRLKFHILKALRGLGVSALPLASNNRRWLLPSVGGPGILFQADTSSCEGHGWASGVTLRYASLRTPIPLASPICMYDGARVLSRGLNPDGTLPKLTDEGTEPSLIVSAMTRWGIASAEKWGDYPASSSTINNEPTLDELETAGEFELDGAYFLSSEGDQFCYDLMTALASGYPCVSAIAASNPSFQNYTGGVLGPLGPQVDHASLWVDYDFDGTNLSSLVFYGVNSWGDGTQGEEPWGESTVTGIAAGMYRFNRDCAVEYRQDCAVVDVHQIERAA